MTFHEISGTYSVRRAGTILLCALVMSSACGRRPKSRVADPQNPASTYVPAGPVTEVNCDVIVAGGSLAALSTALTAAREGSLTCLLEPTDWPGGQLTASGIPAVDFAWHKAGELNVGAIGKDPVNSAPELIRWLNAAGNPGNCWVSTHCFEPMPLLANAILPAIWREKNLLLFKNTVVKAAQVQPAGARTRIGGIYAVRRKPKADVPWGGYDVRLSQDLPDWYSDKDSARYQKEVLHFTASSGTPVVVDATEFGDVLSLSGAEFTQGVEKDDGHLDAVADTCGQAFTLPFVARYNASPVTEILAESPRPQFFSSAGYQWDRIWSYRRLRGTGEHAGAGQLSSQNWGEGNDWQFSYLFKSKADTLKEVADWSGGVDLKSLADAEQHAYGWLQWLRRAEPRGRGNQLGLARDITGTGHGFAKMPYVRDTRRSIGVDGFQLYAGDLQSSDSDLTGEAFADRIAMGAYSVDVHPMHNCSIPKHSNETLPFFVPLRALTNNKVENLLVAGKTMAQTFLANAATRTHPTEFAVGIGAGAAASFMVRHRLTSTRTMLPKHLDVQYTVTKYAPLWFRIQGAMHPTPNQRLNSLTDDGAYCPRYTRWNQRLGYCVDSQTAYGPFTKGMTDRCIQYGGGQSCTKLHRIEIQGHVIFMQRWERRFARGIRGSGECMPGAHRDQKFPTHCVEEPGNSASGAREIYGPFEPEIVQRCFARNGGDACFTNRWSYAFYDHLRSGR